LSRKRWEIDDEEPWPGIGGTGFQPVGAGLASQQQLTEKFVLANSKLFSLKLSQLSPQVSFHLHENPVLTQKYLKGIEKLMIKHRLFWGLAVFMAALVFTTVALAAPPQENGEKYFTAGLAALKNGDGVQAAAQFTKALEVDPDWVEAYVNRGQAYVFQGEWDKAIKDFDQALKLDPETFEALYNRGRVYTKMGHPDKAVADYTVALKLKKDDWQVYYNRGNAYLDAEKYQEALKDYNQALKLDPKNPGIIHNRGLAELALGQASQALEDFGQALTIDPKFALAQYNRGRALEKLGRFAEARGAYRTFLQEANPTQDKPLLEKALERLKELKEKGR
jgi:tetratricopeptide (TPR) repeat protein